MSDTARRRQPPIMIRSAKAVARLALLTRDGRSQAQVIEDALERMPLPRPVTDRAAVRAEIEAIVARGRGLAGKSMTQIDAEMYDENGLPR